MEPLFLALTKLVAHQQYKTSCAFKVATATSWLVILNRNHADDIIKSSDDTFSLAEAMADVGICRILNSRITLTPTLLPYGC